MAPSAAQHPMVRKRWRRGWGEPPREGPGRPSAREPDPGEGDRAEPLLGPHAVREALRAGRRKVRRILLARDARDERFGEIVLQAARLGIPVRQVRPERLAAIASGDRHQGVVALADPFAYAEPEGLAARALGRGPAPLLVALDGVEDPQNLGAILRTAEVLGAEGVILPRHRAAGVTPAVERAASGAVEHLAVGRAGNMAACLDRLKALGYWVCGAHVQGGVPLPQADLVRPLVVVVGGEHIGLRPGLRDRCDFLVTIPMGGRVGSLNAGVATALILYEARRQRWAAKQEKAK